MIALSVNGLNTLMKTQIAPDWIKKTRPNHILPTRNTLEI